MNEIVTQEQIEEWIKLEEDEFQIKDFRYKHELSPEDGNLYTAFNRLCDGKKIIKRLGRGWYKKIKPVSPLKIGGVDSEAIFDLSFPKADGYNGDYSTFGFEDIVKISEGDQIILAGRSNAGKTTLAHKFLSSNVSKHEIVLMGNEYDSNEGLILPKYLRRFKKLDEYAPIFREDGELNFTLLPVHSDYEDYVVKDKINIIDWLGLEKDWFRMASILKSIKRAVGRGISIVVLQKKRGTNYGYGDEQTEQHADLYLSIDPMGKWEGRITMGKVKETHGRQFTRGRMWGFETPDGSNLLNLREIKVCPKCYGKGYTAMGGKCEPCLEKGYINLDTSF